MPQDDDDLPATPKCLLCGERREGQRYRLWGATHVSTVAKTPFFSNVTTVTTKYRNMKRVGYHACWPCARWAVRRAFAPSVSFFAVLTLAFLVAAVAIPQDNRILKIVMVVVAGMAALPAVGLVTVWLLRPTASESNDGLVRDRATRLLRAKGKGDTHLTELEYETMIVKNPVNRIKNARHETAAELLEGLDDEDDDDDDVKQDLRRRK